MDYKVKRCADESLWEWRPSKRFKLDTDDDECSLMEKENAIVIDAVQQLHEE